MVIVVFEWKHKQEFIRISLTAPDQDLEEGLTKIGKVVQKVFK